MQRAPGSPARAIWEGAFQAGAASGQGNGSPWQPRLYTELHVFHSAIPGEKTRAPVPVSSSKEITHFISSFHLFLQKPPNNKRTVPVLGCLRRGGAKGPPLCFLGQGGEKLTGYNMQKPLPSAWALRAEVGPSKLSVRTFQNVEEPWGGKKMICLLLSPSPSLRTDSLGVHSAMQGSEAEGEAPRPLRGSLLPTPQRPTPS